MLVYRECVDRGRKVYLDFTKNPFDITFSKLSQEAFDYLDKAGATFGTPIERLAKMNAPAIELYKSKGVDLHSEYLQIALCAQHCNGGVGVDMWWQTSVKGLFAVGECAGTHGISRPGGSALNAGQVGSVRAAQYISQHPGVLIDEKEFLTIASETKIKTDSNAQLHIQTAQRRMSDHAAAVRDTEKIKQILEQTIEQLKTAADPAVRDVLLTQAAVLTAMSEPHTDPGTVQEVVMTDKGFEINVREVRPIPQDDAFFENVWRSFRQNGNIY